MTADDDFERELRNTISPSRQVALRRMFAYSRIKVPEKTKGKVKARIYMVEEALKNIRAGGVNAEDRFVVPWGDGILYTITPSEMEYVLGWLAGENEKDNVKITKASKKMKRLRADEREAVEGLERKFVGEVRDDLNMQQFAKFIKEYSKIIGSLDAHDFETAINELEFSEVDSGTAGDTYEKLRAWANSKGFKSDKDWDEYEREFGGGRRYDELKAEMETENGIAKAIYYDLQELAGLDETAYNIVLNGLTEALADPEMVDWLRKTGHGAQVDKLQGVVDSDSVESAKAENESRTRYVREGSQRAAEKEIEQAEIKTSMDRLEEQARLQADIMSRTLKETLKDTLAPMRREITEVREEQSKLKEILEKINKKREKPERIAAEIVPKEDKVADKMNIMRDMERGERIEMTKMGEMDACIGCGTLFYRWSESVQNKFINFPQFYGGDNGRAYFAHCDDCHANGWVVYEPYKMVRTRFYDPNETFETDEVRKLRFFPVWEKAEAEEYAADFVSSDGATGRPYIKPHNNSLASHATYPTVEDYIYAAAFYPGIYPHIFLEIDEQFVLDAIKLVHEIKWIKESGGIGEYTRLTDAKILSVIKQNKKK